MQTVFENAVSTSEKRKKKKKDLEKRNTKSATLVKVGM